MCASFFVFPISTAFKHSLVLDLRTVNTARIFVFRTTKLVTESHYPLCRIKRKFVFPQRTFKYLCGVGVC